MLCVFLTLRGRSARAVKVFSEAAGEAGTETDRLVVTQLDRLARFAAVRVMWPTHSESLDAIETENVRRGSPCGLHREEAPL